MDGVRVRKSRTLALTAVVALHAALVAALLVASQSRRVSVSGARPLEIMLLPRAVNSAVHAAPSLHLPALSRELPWSAVPSLAVPDPGTAAPTGGHPNAGVDWDEEARTVAADKARGAGGPAASAAVRGSKPTSPFAPPPAHHAGEEFTTITGQRAVYINESCYQVASPFSYSPNASNNGMGVQTYCNRRSGAARGDLFEDLSAYKKRHPGG